MTFDSTATATSSAANNFDIRSTPFEATPLMNPLSPFSRGGSASYGHTDASYGHTDDASLDIRGSSSSSSSNTGRYYGDTDTAYAIGRSGTMESDADQKTTLQTRRSQDDASGAKYSSTTTWRSRSGSLGGSEENTGEEERKH
jgi:hypothetical protein